jgi:hypothetical protein
MLATPKRKTMMMGHSAISAESDRPFLIPFPCRGKRGRPDCSSYHSDGSQGDVKRMTKGG